MSNWIGQFDERQQKEIAFSVEYAAHFRHGTDGHNAKLIIAQMVQMLDGSHGASLDWNSIAASAFRAYSANRSGKDVRGGNIPPWEEVSAEVKVAWQAAVRQGVDVYLGGSFGLSIEEKWADWTPPLPPKVGVRA